MSVQVKRRRDTQANVAAYIGAQGELIVDTTNNRVTVHDGVTPGGWAAAKLSEIGSAGSSVAKTTVSDANYTVLSTDRVIGIATLTAARTLSLPAASSFPTAQTLLMFDESGAASSSLAVTVAANGSDKIDGAASIAINSAYGFIALQSNGVAKWTVVARAASNLPGVGIGTALDPNNALSVYGASALFNGTTFNFTLNKSAAANTASVLFQDGFSGRAQVGLCGDDNFHFKVSPDGATWNDAININASTGQPTFAQGIAAGEAVGFRNRLRNASFAINQRGVSGTVTLAAGAYGHDGVKAGASGATYTFSTSGIDTTITISSGSLILPIESAAIEGGSYTLSQAGTARARVWQGTGSSGSGTYAACPQTVTGLTAATQTNVEFTTGTILRPQFEPGAVATAFERRPPGYELRLCQRYYWQPSGVFIGIAYSTLLVTSILVFPTTMRAAPTISGAIVYDNGSALGTAAFQYNSTNSVQVYNSANNWVTNHNITISASLSAEI
jgi:hypothetical protein